MKIPALIFSLVAVFSTLAVTSSWSSGGSEQMTTKVPEANPAPSPSPAPTATPTPTPSATPKPSPTATP